MHRGITFKFVVGSVIALVAVLVTVFLVVLPRVEDAYLEQRKESLIQVVDLAVSLAAGLNEQVAQGKLTLAEAQQTAARQIGGLRYNGSDYLWVSDLTPTFLAHPLRPELVGKSVTNFSDARVRENLLKMTNIGREKGSGFLRYEQLKPGKSTTEPKLSYLKHYEPWGWIIGSGIYIDDVHAYMAGLRTKVLLLALLFLAANALFLYAVFQRVIVNPLERITGAMAEIAQGAGDISKRLPVESDDEFGRLAEAFNGFAGQIQGTLGNLSATLEEVSNLSSAANNAVHALKETANDQNRSIDEVSATVEQFSSSIRKVSDDAENLFKATEIASSSTLEISSSITDITGTTNNLDNAAQTISVAIGQITGNLKQLTANLVVLGELTRSASTSAANISESIKGTSRHAQEQATIARDVKEAADTTGLAAVHSTKEGMEKIRREVFTTNETIENLSAMSDQIGRIIGVISHVAEETSLLALNAAILAAQAGPHGKAFAVVAETIRGLAGRTAVSTKDISAIIGQVQREIEMAGKAVKRSIGEVDRGVLLSLEAESALQEIVSKAETSLQMALEVESSVILQSKNVEMNASAIKNFERMFADIKKSIDKQTLSVKDIQRGVDELRAGTSEVKETLTEEAKESERIAEIVNSVFSLAQVIARGSTEQERAAGEIARTIEMLKRDADGSFSLAQDLESVIVGLNRQSALLGEKAESFRPPPELPPTGLDPAEETSEVADEPPLLALNS